MMEHAYCLLSILLKVNKHTELLEDEFLAHLLAVTLTDVLCAWVKVTGRMRAVSHHVWRKRSPAQSPFKFLPCVLLQCKNKKADVSEKLKCYLTSKDNFCNACLSNKQHFSRYFSASVWAVWVSKKNSLVVWMLWRGELLNIWLSLKDVCASICVFISCCGSYTNPPGHCDDSEWWIRGF